VKIPEGTAEARQARSGQGTMTRTADGGRNAMKSTSIFQRQVLIVRRDPKRYCSNTHPSIAATIDTGAEEATLQ
jgi:hypothetical protein